MADPLAPFAPRVLSREQILAAMVTAPPPSPELVASLVENADVFRDDYAAAMLAVVDATAYGGQQRLVRYGVGAAVGALAGAALVYAVVRK